MFRIELKWVYSICLIGAIPILAFFTNSNSHISVAWDLSPRTLTYIVAQQEIDDQGQLTAPKIETVQLVFQDGTGDVILNVNGKEHPSTMTTQGRIYPKDPEASYFYWEIFFMSVLPPDGEAVAGKSWELKRPGDKEIEDLATITSQAQINYEVESLNPLVIKYRGLNRISPSSKLDAMAEDYGVSKVLVNELATGLKPYAEGKVEFSASEGSTLSAEGIVVPWAAFGPGNNVKENPGRIHFKITRI